MIPLPLGMQTVKIARSMNLSITAGFHMQAENLTCHLKLNKVDLVNKAVYKLIYNNLYQYVDGIHYPTQFIQNIFENNIKQKTNGYVISNGVHSYVQKRNISKPDELKDKIVILSIGRFSREKCQDTLIKSIYHSKYKDKIQLILGGQGAKEKAYKKMSKKLPIPPIMKLFDREEIINVINYSDIYAHPAEVELEGIACLEAITCGKLTIVSDSKLSATKDFAIDNKCIFKNRNSKDLAKVIDYWIEHREEKNEYENKYLNNTISYKQDECMQKMEDMIIEIYNKKESLVDSKL